MSMNAMVFLPPHRRAHMQPLVTTFLYTFNSELPFLRFCDFFKKICRLLHENLTVFIGKCKSSNVPVKTVRYFYKNCQIFFKFCS